MTKYVEFVSIDNLANFPEPVGPGYPEVFDKTFETKGYSEARVWVWVNIHNYQTNPIRANSQLDVRFLHQFSSGDSFDYEEGTITGIAGFSSIYGYVSKPIIGDETRIICHPLNLPPGPYDVRATYYLVEE